LEELGFGDGTSSTLYLGSRRRARPSLADVYYPPAGVPVGVKGLLAARDKDKDSALSPAELGCDAKAFAPLDADGDGRLDTDEIAAWLRQPPDLDLAYDLPTAAGGGTAWLLGGGSYTRPAQTGTVKVTGKGRLGGEVKPDRDGALAAALPGARLRFAADARAGSPAGVQVRAATDGLRAVFTRVAGTADVVERKQLADTPEFQAALPVFDFADRDKDGTVTTADLDRLARTGDALVNCRTVIEVADLGRGLFELLDRNGDGTLSPRELNAAVGILDALDRDGDGTLAPTELPRGYAVTAKPASVDVFPAAPMYDFNVVGFVGASPATRPVVPAAAPEWFRHADRNGDGDVSAREFPGLPALFKKMDADGDGLVSPEEARAFEAKPPAGR
jgi:Ca2+-binding EF-hand superfamily protein